MRMIIAMAGEDLLAIFGHDDPTLEHGKHHRFPMLPTYCDPGKSNQKSKIYSHNEVCGMREEEGQEEEK